MVPFLHPLKTHENIWFTDVFSGYKGGTLTEKWVELSKLYGYAQFVQKINMAR